MGRAQHGLGPGCIKVRIFQIVLRRMCWRARGQQRSARGTRTIMVARVKSLVSAERLTLVWGFYV
ncbi:hypothetical protein BC358_00150 [Hydrogenophaga sp. H7]|nr:hypothetical protein BC358_00150 [Hydrogenophaga sp. H7]